MGYVLKKKNININKLPIISNTQTGIVYRLNSGIAIKVLRESMNLIGEEESNLLSDIRCDRILLPKNNLYKDGQFAGYSFALLHEKRRLQKITLTDKEDLVAEVELLEDDIDNLSNNNVLLDGIHPNNIIYCNGIYIPDVSQFKILFENNYSKESLKEFNYYELFLLINNLINNELKIDKIEKETIDNFNVLLSLKDDDVRLSEYLDDVLDNSKNIKQLIKKI